MVPRFTMTSGNRFAVLEEKSAPVPAPVEGLSKSAMRRRERRNAAKATINAALDISSSTATFKLSGTSMPSVSSSFSVAPTSSVSSSAPKTSTPSHSPVKSISDKSTKNQTWAQVAAATKTVSDANYKEVRMTQMKKPSVSGPPHGPTATSTTSSSALKQASNINKNSKKSVNSSEQHTQAPLVPKPVEVIPKGVIDAREALVRGPEQNVTKSSARPDSRADPNPSSNLKGRKDDTAFVSKALAGLVETKPSTQQPSSPNKKANKKKTQKTKTKNGSFIPLATGPYSGPQSSQTKGAITMGTRPSPWAMGVEPKVSAQPHTPVNRQGRTPGSRLAEVSSTTNQKVKKAVVLRIVMTSRG